MMRFSQDGKKAAVICDGKTVYTVDLSKVTEKTTFSPKDGVEITAENGKIGFTKSTCKGQDCIKCGMVSSSYETAVCVPNKIMIIISDSDRSSDKLDAILY